MNKATSIIDVHQHLWKYMYHKYKDDSVEHILENNAKYGIKESWMSCFPEDGRPFDGKGDRLIEKAFRKYPQRIRGMGFILLGRDRAEKIREFKDRGFFGLKIIFPQVPYDDPACDEIWAEAVNQKMPITFHTGEEVGGIAPFGNPLYMTPDRLIRVAYHFPELIIIAAHMGNTRFQSACCAANYPNVYLDCSGGSRLKKMPKSYFDNTINWQEVKHKIMFGVDNLSVHMKLAVESTSDFITKVKLNSREKELLWHGNAEEIIRRVGG